MPMFCGWGNTPFLSVVAYLTYLFCKSFSGSLGIIVADFNVTGELPSNIPLHSEIKEYSAPTYHLFTDFK
jgi:hypothetical protein